MQYFSLDNFRSEEVLGKALRRVPRHTYYIGTKVLITIAIAIIVIPVIGGEVRSNLGDRL